MLSVVAYNETMQSRRKMDGLRPGTLRMNVSQYPSDEPPAAVMQSPMYGRVWSALSKNRDGAEIFPLPIFGSTVRPHRKRGIDRCIAAEPRPLMQA